MNNLRSLFGIFLLSVLLLGLPSDHYAHDGLIKVGIYDFDPLSTIDEKEHADGMFVRLFNDIAEKEGWRYLYAEGPLPILLEQLENGDLDLVLASYYDKHKKQRFDYSQETVISTWAQVYANNKSEIQSLLDLSGKTIGVVRDDPYNEELRAIVKRFNVDCQFVEFNQYEEIFKSLDRKWVDAGVIDRLYAVPHEHDYRAERIPIIFSPVELRIATTLNQNQKLISTIDYHLNAMKKDKHSLYYSLINQLWDKNEETAIPVYVLWGLGITIGLFLISGGASLFLRHQIKKKTAEIRNKNKALEKEISMRRNAEEALRSSHLLLSKTISSMHDSLLVIDSHWANILDCNSAAAQAFGYSQDELMCMSPDALFQKSAFISILKLQLQQKIKEQGFLRDSFEMNRQDGQTFPAEIVVTPIQNDQGKNDCWVVIIRDITDRIALQESEMRLQQAQKMEAIGTLAGGIAHDFNNILMPIMGYSELLLHTMSEHEVIHREYIEQILQAGHRAKALVSQILAFSRKREQEKEIMRFSLSVQEALRLIRASLPSTIDIRVFLDTDDDAIYADPTQIHQLIMNLCTNAAQAMRDAGGMLEVGLTKHKGAIIGWSSDSELRSGPYLRFWVKDTGHGIEPHVLPRIFDPFFTTKKLGEGTGMGLSVVHGIVKSYGGAVSVETQPGRGTVFHIYLPFVQDEIVPDVASETEYCEGRSERILMVDDEPMIVDMVERMLTTNGYQVVSHTSSMNALNDFIADPNAFHLVMSDQTMPGLTGIEMAKEILSIRPDIPIILCTGYSETVSPEKAHEAGIREYIYKPFLANEISSLIRRVIDESYA